MLPKTLQTSSFYSTGAGEVMVAMPGAAPLFLTVHGKCCAEVVLEIYCPDIFSDFESDLLPVQSEIAEVGLPTSTISRSNNCHREIAIHLDEVCAAEIRAHPRLEAHANSGKYDRILAMTSMECLDQLRSEYGLVLSLEGQAPGGEVGAFFARSTDNERYVFKWTNDPSDLAYFERVVERVAQLRLSNYPIPEYLSPFQVPGGVILLQREVDGSWSDVVGHELVDTILRLSDLQQNQVPEAPQWSEFIRKTLVVGAEGYCVHDSLRGHSKRTQQLLEWVEMVGAAYPDLPARDVVHFDFHHRNMLRLPDGRLSGVIDWEGCVWGDRAFDLVTFCFGLSAARAEPGVEERVWSRAKTIASEDALRAYVAHMALRSVDWAIRHHGEDLERTLDHADTLIQKVA